MSQPIDANLPPPPPPPLSSPPLPVLSYAGPNYAGPAAGGIWRDGNIIVLHRAAMLPDACVKCGGPPRPKRLKQQLTYAHPALYLLCFVALLPAAIIIICVQKKATVMVPMCDRHFVKRRNGILISLFLCLVGTAGMTALAIYLENGLIGILAAVSFIAGLVVALVMVPPTKAKLIDDQYVYMRGGGEAFLAGLPDVRAAAMFIPPQ